MTDPANGASVSFSRYLVGSVTLCAAGNARKAPFGEMIIETRHVDFKSIGVTLGTINRWYPLRVGKIFESSEGRVAICA